MNGSDPLGMGDIEIEGEAGAGLVKVWLSGALKVRRVHVAAEAMQDREVLEELIAAALNDALGKVLRESSAQLQKNMREKLGPELRGWLEKMGF